MAIAQRKVISKIEIDPKNLGKVLFVIEVNQFYDTESGETIGETDENRLSIYPDGSDFPETRASAIETLTSYCQAFENAA